MDQRLQQFCSIKLHYKHGIVTVAFHDDTVFGVIHSYDKVAADLYEVFVLYKAYERFIEQKGWHLVLAHLAGEYGVTIQGKSPLQVSQEVGIAQQNQLKELDANV